MYHFSIHLLFQFSDHFPLIDREIVEQIPTKYIFNQFPLKNIHLTIIGAKYFFIVDWDK
jgi:hypothetical protein